MGIDVTLSTSYVGMLSSEIKDYSFLSTWEPFAAEISQSCVNLLAPDNKTCDQKVAIVSLFD